MLLKQQNCLFVDDEPGVLNALRRTLKSEPYKCRFADGGRQALKMLAHQHADVLISDMRMPQMSGIELLKRVSKDYPQTIRLVLSGWSNTDDVLNAINEGQVYRYIVKPWDERELKAIIRQALEIAMLQKEKQQLLKTLQEHNRDLEKRVEQRTAQLLKIRNQAEIGKYASQIVHDLNNPLHGISGVIDMLRRNLDKKREMDTDETKALLELAKRGTKDLTTIISGILMHVRDQSRLDVVELNINGLILQELKFFDLDRNFMEQVEKKLSLAEKLPSIVGHPVQLKQVLDNLIRNAWDAMADAQVKQLYVATRHADNCIEIEIADTGEGIQPENIDRIFEPEFSTKPVGQGTGLGLASAKTMIESYGGSIKVESRLKRGTAFTVKLPTNHQGSSVPCHRETEAAPA